MRASRSNFQPGDGFDRRSAKARFRRRLRDAQGRTPRQAGTPSDRAVNMSAMHFTPHSATPQVCWHCRHFLALVYQGTAAKCALPPGIQAMPDSGCAFWEREVGADDEPGRPDAAKPPTPNGQVRQDVRQAMGWAP